MHAWHLSLQCPTRRVSCRSHASGTAAFDKMEVLLSHLLGLADPGLWDVPPEYVGAFANVYLQKRARAAAKLGKPYIVEGVGMVREGTAPHIDPMI